MAQTHESEKYYADELLALGIAGQAAILEAELKAGVPLTYRDDKGDLVQKNPDGTITLLKKRAH